MHLLLAQKGALSDGDGEALDLGQTPGDVCFLSAADTELASLAGAHRGEGPTLRLVNILQLKHPMSVDSWVERTGRYAKLIVIRILGGAGYWPYGLEAIHAAAAAHGIKLAVLPGDDKPDPGLARFCTLDAESCGTLWRFLIEGGAENARGFLDACGDVLAGRAIEGEAAPLLKAGVFGAPVPGEAGTVAIVFYRALVQAGQTAPVEALAKALGERGLAVLPVYVSSLKDPVSAATVEALFDTHRPDVVLNLTGFAVSAPGADRTPTVLERDGAPVIQVVLSSSPKEVWEASPQGLNARDLAMNVALPEVDGRVLSRAVSFKSASAWDAATECNVVTHEPVADRVEFVADLAARWVQLRRKAAATSGWRWCSPTIRTGTGGSPTASGSIRRPALSRRCGRWRLRAFPPSISRRTGTH
jgi:cobaltochelatase CobN